MSNANYFDFYKANNVEFYFAILKSKADNKNYQKLAFDFQRDFDKNIIKETIWLANDTANDNITSDMMMFYGEDLQEAFEKSKADAMSRPNGILFKLINDPSATAKEYLEYKKNAEAAVNPNMGDIDNKAIFDKIKKEVVSKELIKYFEEEIREKLKNNENVDWNHISFYQKLSEDFIREFKDKVYWLNISYRQKLSEKFIREFADELNREYLLRNEKLDNNLKEKIKLNFDSWAKVKVKNKIAKIQLFCNKFYKKALIKF